MKLIKRYSLSLVLALALGVFTISCSTSNDEPLDDIQIEPGLQLDLVVSEPLVIDPVAFAFDETGKLYVVEDRGYPDPAEGGTPAKKVGRIALLQDTNGDGEYDNRSEFADEFTYPNGVLPWDGGIFVTCSPDIWYLKDTNGDGKADIRKVVLSGFHDTRTAQIRTSHPTLGLDGWIYVSSGLNGGDVFSPLFPDRDTVSFSASDSRFNPETYEFETVGGKSQFGMAFDAFGHRFGVDNRHPIMQVVIEPRYLNRNPYLPYSQTVKNVSKVAAEAVVFPLSNSVTSADFIPSLMGKSHKGTFTAASSSFIYYGKGLSAEHQGNAFICESAQNLMQRQIMYPDGAAFRSELAYDGKEFMASANEWFRPVYVNQGPEDGLYVVDMHRKIIDHPSYVPEEVRGQLDFESGKDMGRIYRLTKEGYKGSLKNKNWFGDNPTNEELIKGLDSDIHWDRRTAFRLLRERPEVDVIQDLAKIVLESPLADSRVRALWLLHLKNGLQNEVLLKAFKDADAGVRQQAVLIAAERAVNDELLKTAIINTVDDPDMHVHLNTALVLGSLQGPRVVNALAKLAVKDGQDLWMREAILSGVGDRMDLFLKALEQQNGRDSEGYELIMKDLGEMFGNGASIAQCRDLMKMILSKEGKDNSAIGTVLGLAEGISKRPEIKGSKDVLTFLMTKTSQKDRQEFMKDVYEIAQDATAKREIRVNALSLLGYTQDPKSLSVFSASLTPEQLPVVQMAAVTAISTQGKAAGGEILVGKEVWSGFTPQVRSSVITSLVSHPVFVPILLQAIENGVISASDIPSITRKRLMASKNTEIKKRAEMAFSELEGGDRMKIYDTYKSNLNENGDAENGKLVFEKSCAVCHSYGGAGGQVGPDLTGINNQPADAILLHVIVPGYEVYPTYQTISIETKDGSHVAGWTVSETENSITLRTAAGTDESILRSSIKELKNTGLSLMPDGLEKGMEKDEMNDLIAYLKTGSSVVN